MVANLTAILVVSFIIADFFRNVGSNLSVSGTDQNNKKTSLCCFLFP